MTAVAHSVALSRRSILGILRQPQMWVPSMFFPLFFAALNTAALGRTTQLPGFPEADSFLDFMLAATIAQGVLFGGLSQASEIAQDIENGFFERLVAAPTARTAILVGRLAGSATLGVLMTALFVAVFTVFGAEVKAGPAGYLWLLVVGMLLATAIGSIGAAFALRIGVVEAVQSVFPVLFISLFLSSAFFPLTLMHGWFRTAASGNPLSWMVDGTRHLVLVGWSTSEALTAAAVPLAITVVGLGLSLRQLRRRLRVAS